MHAPKILPWIARKAGISADQALKLWQRAAVEAAALTGKRQGSEFVGLAVQRLTELALQRRAA
ncbi:hypothetical protein [Thauera sp.]|uniref:hypothetical protein n=1 Tax=unclassified Thauera TaxID=2609274 RepID=UPI002B7942A8|nr:hypothetical protein [Thauera sp.]HRP24790.1 hypothetical protein [Thauera sp.]HRP65063.1 hypothetical protein [Thauera sp.]